MEEDVAGMGDLGVVLALVRAAQVRVLDDGFDGDFVLAGRLQRLEGVLAQAGAVLDGGVLTDAVEGSEGTGALLRRAEGLMDELDPAGVSALVLTARSLLRDAVVRMPVS